MTCFATTCQLIICQGLGEMTRQGGSGGGGGESGGAYEEAHWLITRDTCVKATTRMRART